MLLLVQKEHSTVSVPVMIKMIQNYEMECFLIYIKNCIETGHVYRTFRNNFFIMLAKCFLEHIQLSGYLDTVSASTRLHAQSDTSFV